MRGCRVASSREREACKLGGGSGKGGWKRMKRKMKAVTGESPLRLSSTKGTRVDQERDDKEGIAAARDAPKWKRARSGSHD